MWNLKYDTNQNIYQKKKKPRLPDIEKRVVVAKGEVEEERIRIGGLAEPNLYF